MRDAALFVNDHFIAIQTEQNDATRRLCVLQEWQPFFLTGLSVSVIENDGGVGARLQDVQGLVDVGNACNHLTLCLADQANESFGKDGMAGNDENLFGLSE